MNRSMVVLVAGIFLCSAFAGLVTAGETEKTVMVAPFEVHSEEPIEYVAKALSPMLASRLDADPDLKVVDEAAVIEALARKGVTALNEDSGREIGQEVGADCVILGTITKIAESISVDVKVVDVAGSKATASAFYEDKTLKGLMDGIGALARTISRKIFDRVVVSAVVVKGNRLIEDDAITLEIQTKVGDVFDPQKVKDDIQRIYDMGYFSDIQVDSTDDPQGKRVTFIVTENPEIAEIRIVGNKELKTSDIQEEVDLKLHTILNRNKAKAAAVQIRKFYQGKGYYNAMVDYRTEDLGEEKVAVVFEIVEQHSMRIKKITIIGNKQLKDKAIKGILATREKNILFSLFTEAGKYKEEQFQEDLDRIKAFYYDHGFLEIKVGEPQITNDAKWIYIKIPVEEGPQYHLSEVKIAGDLVKPEEELRRFIKVVPEELFSREKIQADISSLTDVYGEQGYAFVDITPLTNINADNKTVSLTYDISKGEAVYIEKITVTGNTRTQDKVIRREMRLKEEELYNNKKLKRSRERINNLGYFEDVKINTRRGSGPDRMALEVNVKEKPTGMISAGAGYSSVDNLVGIFQVSQNNFLGRGLQLTLMGQIGGTNRYRFGVTEPYLLDKEITAGFDLFNMEMEYDDFDSDNKGLNLSLGILPFGKEDWRLTFQYGYTDTDISNLSGYTMQDPNDPSRTITVYDVDYDIYQASQDSPITTSAITSILARDTVDDRFYPMQGSLNSVSFEFAGLGGEKFYRTILDSRWYFPFRWGTAFMARGSAGFARGYGGDEVPVFERFYLGGLDSLRGFEARTVGPRGDSTQVSDTVMLTGETCTGGEEMMLFNFEYLFPLIKAAKIRGLVFFDMGNAYAKGDLFDFDLRKSVGFGVRWNSPFGPLRVEWGLNLEPKDDEDSSQFEFSVGTGF